MPQRHTDFSQHIKDMSRLPTPGVGLYRSAPWQCGVFVFTVEGSRLAIDGLRHHLRVLPRQVIVDGVLPFQEQLHLACNNKLGVGATIKKLHQYCDWFGQAFRNNINAVFLHFVETPPVPE